jgi:hypothetical protein
MRLPNPFSRKPTEELAVPVLVFVGEQDGSPERMLKGELSKLFLGRANLLRAYLARVHYGDPKVTSVCLCLRAINGTDITLVETVHSLFAQKFGGAMHLDILFLELRQEEQLMAVCKPFYQRD